MATGTGDKKALLVTVITPARQVLSQEAGFLLVPASDGEMGIQPGHAAMVAALGTGLLRIDTLDGAKKFIAVRGGFLQVKKGEANVLTQEAVAGEEVDAAKVGAEVTALEAQSGGDNKPKPETREALAWARAKQKANTARKG